MHDKGHQGRGLMCAGVEFAELDKVLSAYGQPNDPDLPQQWAMYKLGLFTSSHNINGVANAGAWNRWGSQGPGIATPASGPPGWWHSSHSIRCPQGKSAKPWHHRISSRI